jgi:PTH1 family peptidyl-tRNA hydrolase
MNLSGKAVRYWMQELKVPVENLIVISDDLNIPFGTLRLRKNGSAGGHNGLTNINELIGTQDYARIRVGIGNDFGRGQQIGYVLGELSKEETEQMAEISKRVIDGVKAWATIGADRAMNTVNTKPKQV